MDYRRLLISSALAGAVAVPAEAAPLAAASDASGRAVILIPLTLTKIDDLDFGAVIPSAVSGTVTIDAADGSRTSSGGVIEVPSDVGQRGYFAGGGTASQQVLVAVTPPANLVSTTNAADKVKVLGMSIEGSPLRIIDATRAFFVGVGGTIQVNANQPEGVYEATFDVTAFYF